MANIRTYIESQLLDPLKRYPTKIQDTLLQIITDRIEELYTYTLKFPEIITPNAQRLDIVAAICEQFKFSIREEAELEEQLRILENILYVYRRRGSVDSIENMWKYYGGNLPKNIKIRIPAYNLFRYTLSSWSGKDVFQDNLNNRTGVYEVLLINSNYSIPDLKEFMLRELVAAGNKIYFTNNIYFDLTSIAGSAHYIYECRKHTFVKKEYSVDASRAGLRWSGLGKLSTNNTKNTWSSKLNLFLELTQIIDLGLVEINTYNPLDIIRTYITDYDVIVFRTSYVYEETYLQRRHSAFCTPLTEEYPLTRNLYNEQGNLITSRYPGYFVLAETLLGEEV